MNFIEQIIHFHKAHRVLTHILFWVTAYLLSLAGDGYYYHEYWLIWDRVNYFALTLITQITTAYFLAYFILPKLFNTKQYFWVLLYFVAGLYFICVLARMINIYIHEPLSGVAPKGFETPVEVLTNITKLFLVYFFRNLSLAIVFVFLKLLIDQFEIQKRALSLEKQKAEAELKLLKAQLNPHFLFNTLNNIYSLSLMQSAKTSPAIARLADILDYILYRCNDTFVPLAGEIKLLHDYIELEKLRYDERLEVAFKTTVENNVMIAPLILLSIVENAFKHGAADDTGKPIIHIELNVTGDIFNFKVVNSINTALIKVTPDNEKIGLHNLKQQLQLVYAHRYDLEVSQTEGWFTVVLKIDLNDVD